jgi:DNA-binding transcriptional MerR regulator
MPRGQLRDFRPTHRLRPGEAADILGVYTKALKPYVDDGALTTIRTPGGHRRYDEREVRALLALAQIR